MPPRRPRLFVGALLLLGVACSDRLAGPVEAPDDPEANGRSDAGLTLPEFVVSDARGASRPADSTLGMSAPGTSAQIAYVSLPPGSLPTVETASIRNMAGSDPAVTVPVIDGGFDPVPIAAVADNELELTLIDVTGAVSVAYDRVPRRRPPVVVRTFPMKGRTDVAFDARPLVVFSEPIDERTLAAGVRFFRGQEELPVTVEMGGEPWEARVVPAHGLDAWTTYELRITRTAQDLEGDSLEAPVNVAFTTVRSWDPPLVSWGNTRIAFARPHRERQSEEIIIGNPDGSISRFSSWFPNGYWQSWLRLSPDGKKLLIATDMEMFVRDVDGWNERSLEISGFVSWSPDGTRILFLDSNGLNAIDPDSSESQLLLAANSLPSGSWDLDVSPDGTLAFGTGGEILVAEADGSRPRRIGGTGMSLRSPDWSPDGARIAYIAGADGRTIGSMAADGSDVRVHFRTLRDNVRVGAPHWSPDGRYIAFDYDESGGRIYAVNVESGAVGLLVPGPASSISWAAVDP